MGNNKKEQLDMSDLGASLPAAAAALSAEDRAGLVNALKNKLQNLAGEHSDVLENLSPAVRKRVEVLRDIQSEHDELEAKFFEERAALELKYHCRKTLKRACEDLVNSASTSTGGKAQLKIRRPCFESLSSASPTTGTKAEVNRPSVGSSGMYEFGPDLDPEAMYELLWEGGRIVPRAMPDPIPFPDKRTNKRVAKLTVRPPQIFPMEHFTKDPFYAKAVASVILGKQLLAPPAISDDLKTFMAWADQVRRLKVMANADTHNDALTPRNIGAHGIGLLTHTHTVAIVTSTYLLQSGQSINKSVSIFQSELKDRDGVHHPRILQQQASVGSVVDFPDQRAYDPYCVG